MTHCKQSGCIMMLSFEAICSATVVPGTCLVFILKLFFSILYSKYAPSFYYEKFQTQREVELLVPRRQSPQDGMTNSVLSDGRHIKFSIPFERKFLQLKQRILTNKPSAKSHIFSDHISNICSLYNSYKI